MTCPESLFFLPFYIFTPNILHPVHSRLLNRDQIEEKASDSRQSINQAPQTEAGFFDADSLHTRFLREWPNVTKTTALTYFTIYHTTKSGFRSRVHRGYSIYCCKVSIRAKVQPKHLKLTHTHNMVEARARLHLIHAC